jgi:hypothetical protein
LLGRARRLKDSVEIVDKLSMLAEKSFEDLETFFCQPKLRQARIAKAEKNPTPSGCPSEG